MPVLLHIFRRKSVSCIGRDARRVWSQMGQPRGKWDDLCDHVLPRGV